MLLSAAIFSLLLPLTQVAAQGHVELHARQAIPTTPSNATTRSNVTSTPFQTTLDVNGTKVTVQGATLESLNVTQYLGIPFAAPPVGNLRFAPPQLASYSSSINATVIGPACPQPPSALYGNSSEDCLHLNVYAPSAQALTRLNQTAALLAGNNTNITSAYAQGLPVLVWIYGGEPDGAFGTCPTLLIYCRYSGSFTSGSTLPYQGSAVIAQSIASYSPVILVTFNYRVGIW
jgi:carboxylesterase type B